MSDTDHNMQEIYKYLPHRYPFLFLDRILEFEAYKKLVAIKNVTVNEPYFTGHFPCEPVMPGVIMLEVIAQAAGFLSLKSDGIIPTSDDLYYLVGIDKARFKRIVCPGDQLRIEIEVLAVKKNLSKTRGTITVDGEFACSAEIMNAKKAS